MPFGPHAKMTIDQMQARYTELAHQINNAVEEQHQICDELMGRADKAAALTDQQKVDWSVVRDALSDAVNNSDGEMPGDKAVASAFQKNGLLIVHQDDAATINPSP